MGKVHAMFHAVTIRSLTAETRIWSQISSCGIFGAYSGNWYKDYANAPQGYVNAYFAYLVRYVISQLCLKTPTNNLPPPVSSHSSCVPKGHQELS